MLRDLFLTKQQIEELDTHGKIDLDDATLEAMFEWLNQSEEIGQPTS